MRINYYEFPKETPEEECIDARDALDCSLYPECYIIDGDSWFFESGFYGRNH